MVTFKQLWDNHPTITGEGDPCDSSLDDQCAIKLGTALHKCGVKVQGVEQCWFAGHKGKGHYLRAEELANGLKRSIIPGIQPVKALPGKNIRAQILGQTGIVFFKDYWQRKKETFRNRSGDHIDLWNGSRLTSLSSWVRILFGITIPGVWSDFENSRQFWFWRVL